jgi:chromate transporter
MSQAAQERTSEQPVSLASLFIAFLKVSLYGTGGGGGIVWARRIAVENRRWISEQEFADIVSLCQFMPGPNIVGIAVCIGAKTRGASGTIAAICGFLLIPWGIGLSLGLLYLKYAHLTVFRNILGGVAATAAGLLIATGIKLLMPYRGRPAAVLFAALAFGLMVFGELPLLVILFSLVPLGIAVAGIEAARA